MLKLIGEYHGPLMKHLSKVWSPKRNRLTFMSHESQNSLLKILANQVRLSIVKELKQSGLFAVIIDTTTDVANIEQFTFLVRYIHEGKPYERLLCLEAATDATGKGMFDTFCCITEKYQIDWKKDLCAQSYDGAATMQGEYSGLKTLIQNENPRAVYVWCFAHIMNLVIVDTLDYTTEIRNFFGELQGLVSYMRARKRTATFYDCQKNLNVGSKSKDRIRKIKNFSDTRWTSHDRVISVIHDKFDALIDTLKILSSSTDRVTSSNANIFLQTNSSFSFILILKLMGRIFSITTPTSCYLQSKNIDFIQAFQLIDNSKKQLGALRSDEKFIDLVRESRQFSIDHNLLESNFKESRVRKKKKMSGEQVNDEITVSPSERFKINTYFTALDQIKTSINNRYNGAREIFKDLSLLSPNRLMEISRSPNAMPKDSFLYLSQWIKDINVDKLKNEYIVFSKNITELINCTTLPTELHSNVIETSENMLGMDSNDESSDDERTVVEDNTKSYGPTALEIMHLLSTHDLKSAFPNLYLAYQGLCTMPSSSASAERSFSKVKLIKTRLRSTMGQSRLESLLILSSERDKEINIEDAINTFGNSSNLLKKCLMSQEDRYPRGYLSAWALAPF
ncbi:zinc finger MYM-type protein 1-like, partial [Myzus persicae]|uniref:zinc finger MYM-type protein 1-like n=1 Tax=Myzus persicae TaxID=13164 RepID=UPI000B9385EA